MDFPLMVRGNLVIIDATNPRYANADGTLIDLDLTIADAERGTVQIHFSATMADTEEHGRDLFMYAESLTPTPYVETKEGKKKQITAKRYERETAGITVGGIFINTERDSQAMVTGATLSAMLDNTYVCNWKTPNGFVQLDATALVGIAQTMRAHVQACFDREGELFEAVENETYVASMLNQGWPT